MNQRAIAVDNLNQLKFVSEPQVAPTGDRLVFTVKEINTDKNRYFSNIYLFDFSEKTLRQYTFGQTLDSQPRWSPQGDRLSFIRSQNGDNQIWTIAVGGGEARQLTHLDEGSIGLMAWSPDGSHLAFEFRPTHLDWTSTERKKRIETGKSNPVRMITRLRYRTEGKGFIDRPQQVWCCEVENGLVHQVTTGEVDCREPVWLPNGTEIAFISNRSEDPERTPFHEDIWIISLNGGPIRKVSSPDGYKWGLASSPLAGHRHLAYIGSETREDPYGGRNEHLWIVDSITEKSKCLTMELDRSTENATLSDIKGNGNQNPTWSMDGKTIYHLVSDKGSTHFYQTDLHGFSQPIIDGNLDIGGFSVGLGGNRLALMLSTAIQPSEIYTAQLDNNHTPPLEQITSFNQALMQSITISEPEEFWFTSFDGETIQAWILKPAGIDPSKQYPLVLYIHGGPAAQYGHSFFHEFQVLAAQGFIVLYTNPRGSLGRDSQFVECIRGDWGNLDYRDLMAAVDTVQDFPYVDGKRMAVMGGSYGGFMTTWIVGNTNRFRCAISERGISNRHSAVGSNDFNPLPDGYWAGNPWDRPEKLWQQSPLRFAAEIDTPLLIIHSEGDLRCPISQAEQLFSALKKQGKEVVFLRFPSETNHGLSRNGPPDLRIERLDHILNWLKTYLTPSADIS